MIRQLLATFLLLLSGAAAQAASFDCNRAQTIQERTICADPELSAADETLAVAYASAIGGLSDAAAEEMRRSQRGWIDYLGVVCADYALPGEESLRVERVGCVLREYVDRVAVLENSRMLGGLRFYTVDRYGAAPDPYPDVSVYSKLAVKQVSAPRIDGETTTARGFNSFITDVVDENTRDFARRGGTTIVLDDAGSDSELRMAVQAVNEARITVAANRFWFEHGAAHGNYGLFFAHFLREEGRPLEAADIFGNRNWDRRLADLVRERLESDLGENFQGIDEDSLQEAVRDTSRWDFSVEGLRLQFQPYEVSAYAFGAPVVTIPWSALEGDLADSAYEIAVYE